MKIKLVKVKTATETVFFNYGDDYNDVCRHLVESYSDFEEVDLFQFDKIKNWVQQYNIDSKKRGGNEYILIATDEIITVKSVIADIIKKEDEMKERWRLEEEKLQKKKEEEKAKRAANKVAKLQRQLEKAQKEASLKV